MDPRIHIVEGDITRCDTAAIVNAANSSLLGGGGVDGAIHRAAGPELLAACRGLGGCPTGDARITRGYRLPAEWVIHTVGPVWAGGVLDEDGLLERCYERCFALAREKGIRSIAFPAISTGVYRFPLERAARIALNAAERELLGNATLERVMLVCFGREAVQTYRAVADRLGDDH